MITGVSLFTDCGTLLFADYNMLENTENIWHKTAPNALSRVCAQKQKGTEYTK